MRRLIFLSGYPGSGKSTLAVRLASRLEYPLVSKDAILITIFEAQDLPARQVEQAGKAAWAVFWHMARGIPRAVLDTNIKPRNAVERAELAALRGARTVEVRCICPIEVAMHRYTERGRVGNFAQRVREPSLERFAEYEGPIGLDDLVEVDTTSVPDVEAVASQIERLFSTSVGPR